VTVSARVRGWLGIAAVVLGGLVIAFAVQDRYYHRVVTLVFLWAAMGLAWNIISGYAGQISFGHQAFFGIGAYVTVLLVVKAGLTPWLGMVAAMAAAVLAAVLIGIPTFRLAGIYFGLATLAYPLIFRIVMDWLGYQEVSIPMQRERPGWFMQFTEPRSFDLLALSVLAATLALSRVIEDLAPGLSPARHPRERAGRRGDGRQRLPREDDRLRPSARRPPRSSGRSTRTRSCSSSRRTPSSVCSSSCRR
jgi:branched-chain amino acid transport system permease protein